MSAPAGGVVIKRPHGDLGDDDFHEWITFASSSWTDKRYGPMRVALDAINRVNPKAVYGTNAVRWICNNPDCSALAFVRDDAIVQMIEAAEVVR